MKNLKPITLIITLAFFSLFLYSCTNNGGQTVGDNTSEPTQIPDTDTPVGLPNPASVHCEEQGGTVEIRTDDEGNQYGVCVFEDGSECEEWAFFRGECQSGQPDNSTSDINLTDKVWVLQEYGQPLLPNTMITIEFAADGQVHGSAGCNSYFGSYSIDGSSLITSPIGSTEMWCEGRMDQESAFLQMLQTATDLTVIENALTIHTPDGDMQFTPAENATLEGTGWVLSGIAQGDAIVNTWVDANINIQFNDSQVSGNAGCNSYGGSYQIDGSNLILSELISTMMACEEEISQREAEFLAGLATVSQFRTEMNQLTLSNAMGQDVLFFTADQS